MRCDKCGIDLSPEVYVIHYPRCIGTLNVAKTAETKPAPVAPVVAEKKADPAPAVVAPVVAPVAAPVKEQTSEPKKTGQKSKKK
jgi:hypothetical protein